MPNNPNIIIEIGDRLLSNLGSDPVNGELGYALRAVIKFTFVSLPTVPRGSSKRVRWIGPLGEQSLPLTERGGQWEAADAASLLRKIADLLETPNSQSADKAVRGDLLTVMAHELKKD